MVVRDTAPRARPVAGDGQAAQVAEQAVPQGMERAVEEATQAPATVMARFPVIPVARDERAGRE